MRRLAVLLILGMALWGCKAVPVIDDQGNPTGEVTHEFDPDLATDVGNTIAATLPENLNLIGAAVVSLFPLLLGGKDE